MIVCTSGLVQMGPASLRAVKEGDIGLPYDTAYILAQVNADKLYKQQNNHGQWQVTGFDQKSVGESPLKIPVQVLKAGVNGTNISPTCWSRLRWRRQHLANILTSKSSANGTNMLANKLLTNMLWTTGLKIFCGLYLSFFKTKLAFQSTGKSSSEARNWGKLF